MVFRDLFCMKLKFFLLSFWGIVFFMFVNVQVFAACEDVSIEMNTSDKVLCIGSIAKIEVKLNSVENIIWQKKSAEDDDFVNIGDGYDTLFLVAPSETAKYRAAVARCPSVVSGEVSISVEDTSAFSFKAQSQTKICRGFLAEMRLSKKQNVSVERIYDDGSVTSIDVDSKSIEDVPSQSAVYTATFSGTACPAVVKSIRYEVEIPKPIRITTDNDKVCSNSNVELTANDSNIKWYMRVENSEDVVIDEKKSSIVVPVTERTIFHAESDSQGVCPRQISNELEVMIDETLNLEFSKVPDVVCYGDTVSIKATLSSGSILSYKWEAINDNYPTGKVISNSLSMEDKPSVETTYRVTLEVNGCPDFVKSYTVAVEDPFIPSLSVDEQSVCKNSPVALRATYGNATKVSWQKQENEDFGFIDFSEVLTSSVSHNPQSNVAYRLVASGFKACPETYSDIVFVKVEDSVSVKITGDTIICPGARASLHVETNAKAGFVWGELNKKTSDVEVSPASTSVYSVTANGKYCPPATAFFTVNVEEIPALNINSSKDTICLGDEVTLSTDFPLVENVVWEKLNNEGVFAQVSMGSDSYTDLPALTSIYMLKATTQHGCDAGFKKYTVRVDELATSSVEDKEICYGDSTTLVSMPITSKYRYLWSSTSDFSDTLSTEGKIEVTPDKSTTYFLKVSNGVCSIQNEANVDVNELPWLTGFEYDGQHNIAFFAEGGTGTYEFDFGNGFSPSHTFNHIGYGKEYLIKVRDEKGCEVDTLITSPTYDIEFNVVFTPDGDGINDTWKITNLEKYDGARVSIYDRSGMLLFQAKNSDLEWDGTYNGKPMPSSDYWYVVDVEELDLQYLGHFTLLRSNE